MEGEQTLVLGQTKVRVVAPDGSEVIRTVSSVQDGYEFHGTVNELMEVAFINDSEDNERLQINGYEADTVELSIATEDERDCFNVLPEIGSAHPLPWTAPDTKPDIMVAMARGLRSGVYAARWR